MRYDIALSIENISETSARKLLRKLVQFAGQERKLIKDGRWKTQRMGTGTCPDCGGNCEEIIRGIRKLLRKREDCDGFRALKGRI